MTLIIPNANSGTIIERAVCPALTGEASKIISSIQVLSDEVSLDKECETISTKINSVGSILANENWKRVSALLKGEKIEALEVKEVELITAEVTNASQTITEIVSGLSSKPNCIAAKDKGSFLSNLSSVVKEVSSVIGSAAGPYGMAANLGGHLLSSAIIGIDNMLGSQYNFTKPEDLNLFMNQFCSFAEVQKDVNDYLGLETLEIRVAEINELSAYLDIKIKDLGENCNFCEAQVIAWKSRVKSDRIIKRMQQDLNIVASGDDLNNNYFSRCKEMSRAFHTENSDFNQFMRLLDDYENPLMHISEKNLIDDVVSLGPVLKKKYPAMDKCIAMVPNEKVQLSRDFNNLMRDEILPLNDEVFAQQIESFRFLANKKYRDPLGDYTINSLERQKWLLKERDLLLKERQDPNFELSTKFIRKSIGKLKYVFLEKNLPKFLAYLNKENKKDIKQLFKLMKKAKKSDSTDPNIKNKCNDDIYHHTQMVFSETKTALRYCRYSNYMLFTNTEIANLCKNIKSDLMSAYQKLENSYPGIKNRVKAQNFWKEKELVKQQSRIGEYRLKLFEWNKLGDRRWCLKGDMSTECLVRRN